MPALIFACDGVVADTERMLSILTPELCQRLGLALLAP
jgi:beta-phosphoglucomutase-like phosphatase (HAD superfamily)